MGPNVTPDRTANPRRVIRTVEAIDGVALHFIPTGMLNFSACPFFSA